MIEMKVKRLLLTLVIMEIISNDDQLSKVVKTENIAVKQVDFFELDFFN